MQKKKTIYNKLLYFINSIFAFLLLVAYVIPYIKPENLGSFAGISLLTPFLIIINLLFLAHWIFKVRRTFLLSFIILAVGYPNLPRLYKISGKKILLTNDIKVMSYNVRMFNKYQWIDKDSIPQKINNLIEHKSPHIICIQEYTHNPSLEKDYPNNYIEYSGNNRRFGHAIFSQYPIIDKGNLVFKSTANNILFADILVEKDTIRVYNIHLQSLKLDPKKENFGEEDASKLGKRISKVFQEQQKQVDKFLKHQKAVKYPVIVAGDFNNTAYSWPYRAIIDGKKDAFVVAGKGFDKTFDFNFPMRIDFIMVDESVTVNHFKTYRDKYSDHFPILARIHLPSLSESE